MQWTIKMIGAENSSFLFGDSRNHGWKRVISPEIRFDAHTCTRIFNAGFNGNVCSSTICYGHYGEKSLSIIENGHKHIHASGISRGECLGVQTSPHCLLQVYTMPYVEVRSVISLKHSVT